jgi:beta-glucanase (GH16 family)
MMAMICDVDHRSSPKALPMTIQPLAKFTVSTLLVLPMACVMAATNDTATVIPPRDNPLAPLSVTANRVFSDDFDRVPVAAPDGRDDAGAIATWRTSLWFGSGYNRQGGGQAYYTDTSSRTVWGASVVNDNACSVANGILSITAKHHSDPIPGFPKLHYISGLLSTMDSFWIDYGYVEIRLKCPGAPGCWTAFFMYPADDYHNRPTAKFTKWEMDFLEILGGGIDRLHVTTHQQAEAHGKNIGDESLITTGRNDDGFHVFGFDKRPTTVEIWRDGVHILSKPTTSLMTTAGYLCLVLDVGTDGGWAGTPDPTHYPQTLQVDYVRVYRTDATTVVGGPASSVQLGQVRTDGSP